MIFIYKKNDEIIKAEVSYFDDEEYIGYGFAQACYVLENGDKIQTLEKNEELSKFFVSHRPAVVDFTDPSSVYYFKVIPKGCDRDG